MEDTRDYQIIHCKKCGESKKRIRDGFRENSKEIRFVGEDGKEFNGLVCGPCHAAKVKLTKQLNAALKKQTKALNGTK